MTTVLADARRGHPGLFAFALAMAVLTAVLAVLLVIDDRVLLGAPLWLKPLKFSISFVAYAGTLAWLLGRLRARRMQWAGWTIVAAATVEMTILVGQAARGVRSHFNTDTPFDANLFSIMGATIVVLWLATLAIALRFLREPGSDRATATAVRLGLLVALLGLLEGFVIVANGAHTVGLPDGGPGLPLVGWSTTGGDLRVGHFVGMHALQVLPLLAPALARRGGLDETGRTRAVWLAAGGYAGVVALTVWQALRGLPLLEPDGPVLAAGTALLLAVALGAVLVARSPRTAPAAPAPAPIPEVTA